MYIFQFFGAQNSKVFSEEPVTYQLSRLVDKQTEKSKDKQDFRKLFLTLFFAKSRREKLIFHLDLQRDAGFVIFSMISVIWSQAGQHFCGRIYLKINKQT